MGLGPFDHPWLSGLFGDEAMSAIWSSDAALKHMQRFESAWIDALVKSGACDDENALKAATTIADLPIDIDALRAGTARDGVPIPDLVAQLQLATNCPSVHLGATSQDVIDTALVLILRETSELVATRLEELIQRLMTLEQRFGHRPLMGRTRMQAATTITVRNRVANWRIPLQSHTHRLVQLRPDIEKVQIGGASGDRAALGNHADSIIHHMAESLSLFASDTAWHTMRDGIVNYASLLALITGSLGKMGQDIALMAQQGVDDIVMRGGGSSSAMKHKSNPVLAELLITLARFNAVQLSGMHHAMIHEQERSGSAWMLEWMILPHMAMTTGRALSASLEISRQIEDMGDADQ